MNFKQTLALSLAIFGGILIIINYSLAGLAKILFTAIGITSLVYRKKLSIVCKTFSRDVLLLKRYYRVWSETNSFKRGNMTVVKAFRKRSIFHANETCFIFEGKIWTNKDIDEFSNRIASVFVTAKYVRGDSVALMMYNKPEYVAIWLGLAKLGIVTALINTNLRMESLVHCIKIANVRGIIFDAELAEAINEITDHISDIDLYEYRTDGVECKPYVHNVAKLMAMGSTKEPIIEPQPGYNDNFLYIYTSGTTGLPKAAVFRHGRYLLIQSAVYHMLDLHSGDVIYNSIPLYHTAGGVAGTCCALIKGLPSVIRSKFSVSNYWTDCKKYNCTVAQYIGEMCRYLLAAPFRPEDRDHPVRIMLGNGMRPQIWEEFCKRFNIPRVAEIYGSSEGNANIVNIDNTPGALGFLPNLIPKSFLPLAIIRIDPETYEPIRGRDGLCIRAPPNEPGMFIGMIKPKNPESEFSGYLDKKASQKKIIENVFTKGDRAFLSGDILVMDDLGYLYFKDRIGDTFRWKGENVSTAEVEGIISRIADNRDTTVYGVEVPNMEGRAGMAAIVDENNDLDLVRLYRYMEKALPAYARPVFLRITKGIEMTGTFKLRKINLLKEGFDPNVVKDELYFRLNDQYVPITPELYKEILACKYRF